MSRTKALHILCAVLLIALLVLQFTPFWHYGESNELSTSISGYIWFPTDHADLTSHIKANVSDTFDINQIVLTPVLLLVFSAIGAVLCLIQSDSILSSLPPIVCGIAGVWGYLSHPAFQLGAGWIWHLVLCIAVLILGALSLYTALKSKQ